MNTYKINWLVILLITFNCFCSSSTMNLSLKKKTINYKQFKEVYQKNAKFEHLGKFVKIVELETSDNSLIGKIHSIIMNQNGDFLVTDSSSSKKVFLFSKDGKFIRSYGRLGNGGPGEYYNILGAHFFEDESVVLITPLKIMKFNKKGKLVKEVRKHFLSNYQIVWENKLFLHVTAYRNDQVNRSSLAVYDSNLNRLDGIGKYDERYMKFKYIAKNPISKSNGKIIYFNYYDPIYHIADLKSKEISLLQLPNDNESKKNFWEKKRYTRNDTRLYSEIFHRLTFLYGFGNRIISFSLCEEKNIYNNLLIDLKNKTVDVFPYNDTQDPILFRIFRRTFGSYDKGVIVSFDLINDLLLDQYKKRIPLLKKVSFDMDDNAPIGLFEFKETFASK